MMLSHVHTYTNPIVVETTCLDAVNSAVSEKKVRPGHRRRTAATRLEVTDAL